ASGTQARRSPGHGPSCVENDDRRRDRAGTGVGPRPAQPQIIERERRVSNITRVEKPWGYELHWAKTERYVGKLIHVNAGHALRPQYHNVKDEKIYLHSGKLLFEIQDGETLVKHEMLPGQRVHITPKTVH